eukprot:SAG25_NODE_19_length_23408_cov_10.997040_19_plen_84_part_00
MTPHALASAWGVINRHGPISYAFHLAQPRLLLPLAILAIYSTAATAPYLTTFPPATLFLLIPAAAALFSGCKLRAENSDNSRF